MGIRLKIGCVMVLVRLLDERQEALIRKTTGSVIYFPDQFWNPVFSFDSFSTERVFQPGRARSSRSQHRGKKLEARSKPHRFC